MGYFPVPTMRELVTEINVRRHLYLHSISLVCFLAAAMISPTFYMAAGFFLLLANALLFKNLYSAGRVYFDMIKKPRPQMSFDMESFTKKD